MLLLRREVGYHTCAATLQMKQHFSFVILPAIIKVISKGESEEDKHISDKEAVV